MTNFRNRQPLTDNTNTHANRDTYNPSVIRSSSGFKPSIVKANRQSFQSLKQNMDQATELRFHIAASENNCSPVAAAMLAGQSGDTIHRWSRIRKSVLGVVYRGKENANSTTVRPVAYNTPTERPTHIRTQTPTSIASISEEGSDPDTESRRRTLSAIKDQYRAQKQTIRDMEAQLMILISQADQSAQMVIQLQGQLTLEHLRNATLQGENESLAARLADAERERRKADASIEDEIAVLVSTFEQAAIKDSEEVAKLMVELTETREAVKAAVYKAEMKDLSETYARQMMETLRRELAAARQENASLKSAFEQRSMEMVKMSEKILYQDDSTGSV